MKKSLLIWRGLANAVGATAYTALIAWFMFNGEHWFGQVHNFLIPLFMLLLLIISATVTGGLVLGKPLLMYLDGDKKEAVRLLFITIGCLIVFAAIAMVVVAIIQ